MTAEDAGKIVRLIPRRNIETWILCLSGSNVNEADDYKRTRDNWPELIRGAVGTLYTWTRRNAAVPASCVESLHVGIRELQKLEQV